MQVERWFADLTERQIRRGTHRSTKELEAAITEFLTVHNENPKPFVWMKSADQLLESLKSYCHRISETGHQGDLTVTTHNGHTSAPERI